MSPYSMLPIIVYTGRDLTPKEAAELHRLTEAVILKDVKSPDRLLDETALYLHRHTDRMSKEQKALIEKSRQKVATLQGKKVLVVDDDVRNIFALTSVLERAGMHVLYSESGAQGLELLASSPEVDIVLTDVMMPQMDGFEFMRRIRAQRRFKDLPIIAVTAKAMKEDRKKCLAAGANDYITKPVDIEQLQSFMRVWLYNR